MHLLLCCYLNASCIRRTDTYIPMIVRQTTDWTLFICQARLKLVVRPRLNADADCLSTNSNCDSGGHRNPLDNKTVPAHLYAENLINSNLLKSFICCLQFVALERSWPRGKKEQIKHSLRRTQSGTK